MADVVRPRLNVLVAGGTGLVGRPVVRALLKRECRVVVVGRSKDRIWDTFRGVVAKTYEELTADDVSVDVVLNLAGENVGTSLYWTDDTMRERRDSRLGITSKLVELLTTDGCNANARLLNASGISIYGHQDDDHTLSEGSAVPEKHQDFLTQLSIDWEAAARGLAAERLTLLRFGIVLCKGEGALGKMEPVFWLGAGGRIGPGTQSLSWISLEDVTRAILFIIDHPEISGPVNLVSDFVPQIEFASALASALWRPCFIPAPSFALKMVMGEEMANALALSSHHVRAKVLTDAGFVFNDSQISTTLERIYAT